MTWKILVVDDERDIHRVTELALRRRSWKGREFELRSALSAQEARESLHNEQFHVALVDVVMESDDAGLKLCQYIRNNFPGTIRLILRTGQPGAAPEDEVLDSYDIDYYIAKSEATAQNLFKTVRACIRTVEDLVALDDANAELTIANAELSKQNAFRERILNLLGDGEKGFVSQMLEYSRKITQSGPDEVKRLCAALGEIGERMASAFNPEDFRSGLASTLTTKNVQIVLANKKAVRRTQGALAGTIAKPYATTERSEAMERLRTGSIDLLFIDWENRGIVPEANRYNPNLLTILMGSPNEFHEHGKDMLRLSAASAVVLSRLVAPDASDDQVLSIQELVVTAGKLVSKEIFGLDKYLSWGVHVREETLMSTRERGDACERVLEFAKECNLRPNTRRRLTTVLDELLMNAMWAAPALPDGRPKYNHLPRVEPVDLEPGEEVVLRYASDGNHLAVSVTDNFGRLLRNTAFEYIQRCLHRGDDQIKEGTGGAGLGLYLAYMSMSTIIINVDPGRKTEVIGLMDLRRTPRQEGQAQCTIHYFCAPDLERTKSLAAQG